MGRSPQKRSYNSGSVFGGSKTLLSAVELGLFTELASGGPLGADALADRLGLHTRGTRDFLDALVALHMLDQTHDLYTNTPAADLFLDRRKPTYLGGMLEMANARLYPFWGSLTEALRTGQPQNEAKRGSDVFAELYADPERLQGLPQGDDRHQPRIGASHRCQVPLARVSDLRRCWRGRRRVVGERGLGAPTRHGHRVRPVGGTPTL